eukprot:gnl/TRDRNA2_/TRDRNA2_28510_c1_seq1.p1 gnl/TRDRNA2_/TRDRNA2_28510_c1~~gnl/TRDRNA2_/TRDRNA2_28510_c1_seq1.p1  ORF type:complete len:257 (+),score=41.72 gnl/TRDRNA2_/TRDRNA2_28510_c1_seq1:107-772(+)
MSKAACRKTEEGIFQTNALPCSPGSSVGAIFLSLSRVNHSCAPNAVAHWDAGSRRKFLVAICDIQPANEICISYLSSFEDYEHRTKHLRTKFGFYCQCRLCSLPHIERLEDDKGRRHVQKLDAVMPQMACGQASLSASMAAVSTLIKLLQKDGAAPVIIARAALDAYQLCLINGAHNDALLWLQVHARYMELAKGPGSEDARAAAELLQSSAVLEKQNKHN